MNVSNVNHPKVSRYARYPKLTRVFRSAVIQLCISHFFPNQQSLVLSFPVIHSTKENKKENQEYSGRFGSLPVVVQNPLCVMCCWSCTETTFKESHLVQHSRIKAALNFAGVLLQTMAKKAHRLRG